MQLFADTESGRLNKLWLESKPTFEAMVTEIKWINDTHGCKGEIPDSQWVEVRRLKDLLPKGVSAGDLQDAFGVASGRISIDEIYPPDLVRSIEADN